MTFVGIGYMLREPERVMLLDGTNEETYEEVMKDFHPLDDDRENWFFGDILAEIDPGTSKSLDTLAVLPALSADNTKFGLKYGRHLANCGLSVKEINETWGNPTIYICVDQEY